jgi:hypothetical protein
MNVGTGGDALVAGLKAHNHGICTDGISWQDAAHQSN